MRDRQRYRTSPFPRILTKYLRAALEKMNWPSWIQAVSSVVTIAIAAIALTVANRSNDLLKITSDENVRSQQSIAKAAHELQVDLRRAQVKPVLKVTAARVGIGKNEASGIVLSIFNIGTGTAQNLAVMAREGNKPNPYPFQRFFPKGTFPILKPPQIQNIPVSEKTKPIIDLFYMQPILPDNDFGKDFILPGEMLEFQYGCYPFGKTPVIFPMSLVLSYFDIDGIEYTIVTEIVPGFGHLPIQYEYGHPIFDTLKTLSDGVGLYHYNTYLNLGLRDSTGVFKYIPNLDDSSAVKEK